MFVPERFSQIGKPASRNEERTKKRLSFVPTKQFKLCNMSTHVNMKIFHRFFVFCFIFLMFSTHICCNFSTSPVRKIFLIFCFKYYLLCRRGNNHFDVHFWGITPVLFSVEMESTGCMKKNGRKSVYLPPELAFCLINKTFRVLFPIRTSNWCVNICILRRAQGAKTKNESTVIII